MLKQVFGALGVAQSDIEGLFLNEHHMMKQENYKFMEYVTEWNKSYGTKGEYEFREQQFLSNLEQMAEHNSQNGNTFTLGINEFADWTHEEYQKMLGYKMKEPTNQEYELLEEDPVADGVDWTAKGAVTRVKNQGQCGSCWAFSSTGAIEGADFVANGKLNSLSEQQLVDCSRPEGNMGCQGGLMDSAFKYVEKNPLETEDEYPYTGKNGRTCKAKKGKGVGKITSYKDVAPDSVEQMKAALANGPVSVAVEADKMVFQMYSGGVLNSPLCGKQLDHGVLATGWGKDEESGLEYFHVKNSWGPSWGVDGYLKIAATAKNVCGILSQASYPLDKE